VHGRTRAAVGNREAAPDPRELAGWFTRLPEGLRDEIRRDWRADEARTLELVRRARRRILRDALAMAAVFIAGDLVCPQTSAWTPFAASAIGAALGVACSLIHAERLLTGTAGLIAFFAFQWSSRSGLTALHMLVFFDFGILCAYLGYLREEGGMQ
jgi:hypothetical protein